MASQKEGDRTTGTDRATVAGLFRRQADAERAVRDLKDTGITESGIGVAMQDRDGHQEWADDTRGGILGGVVGMLAGVGALALPGVGPIISAGALAPALAGAGTGVGPGGLSGTLVSMGVSEDDAAYFETGVRKGNVLVTVTAGSRGPEAREILRASGADLGRPAREAARDLELWRGNERRYHDDSSYRGPERRYSHR